MTIRLFFDDGHSTEGEVRGDRVWFPSFDFHMLEGESPLETLCRILGKVEVEVF